jgi:hypothetical protein
MPIEDKSILDTVKTSLNIAADDTSFDNELVTNINSSLSTLNQVGVGKSLAIEGESELWSAFKDPSQINGNTQFMNVPQFVYVNVKLIFDPPSNSASLRTMSSVRDELLWRLQIEYDADQPGRKVVS